MWNDFFFAVEDPAAIGLFRICFGMVLLADAVSHVRTARYFLYPDGLLPIADFKAQGLRSGASLFHVLPSSRLTVYVILALYVLFAIGVTVGLAFRFASVGAFVCLVSIQQRFVSSANSGDRVLVLLLFLLIFSNAGKAYSLDNIVFGRGRDGAIWAHRLMQIQVALLYLQATLWKLKGGTWRRGEAVYYATNLITHRKRNLPALLYRKSIFRIATYSTLLVEGAFAFLVWIPTLRYWVLGAAALLHVGLNYFMRMSIFQLVMIVALLVFVEPSDAARVVSFLTTALGLSA
ncbi:MAG: HTTM domain-containing protein [Rhodothermales bacterium]|nr:HTTM domain-containing protein [Rhodothermales bacterium]